MWTQELNRAFAENLQLLSFKLKFLNNISMDWKKRYIDDKTELMKIESL